MTTLEVKDLHASVVSAEGGDDVEILKGVNLTVKSGETHAVMGPNGSGKSTLSYAIAGHPKYTVTSGSITLDGETVVLLDEINVGHKIARVGLKTGDKIIKYGAPIGSMKTDAVRGAHVHMHNMQSDYIKSHTREVTGHGH